MTRVPSQLPSVDGVRAIAILFVLLGHLAGDRNSYGFQPILVALLGVRIFFVLSGFLITYLLLQEQERTGNVSLRKFYLRRILRTFPAFYFFLVVVSILRAARVFHFPWGNIAIAGSFLGDFLATDWNLAHFWSLAVEEQFYLVWPGLLVWVGKRHALRIALAAMVLLPVLSGVFSRWHLPQFGLLLISLNAVATGCALAAARPQLHRNPGYLRFLQSRWLWVLPVPTVLLSCWQGHGAVLLFGLTALLVAVLIDRAITVPGVFKQCFNWGPIAYVGTLSYSLYIWQQLFLNPWDRRPFTTFPLNLLLTAVCALVSFYAVERPFRLLRGRLERAPARGQAAFRTARV